MKILLASADLAEIRWAIENGLIDAIVTDPAMLHASGGGDWRERLSGLARQVPLPLVTALGSISGGDVYRDGKELSRLSDHLGLEIPFVEDTLPAIRRLRAEGVRVTAAFVHSVAQLLLAVKAGALAVTLSHTDVSAAGRDVAEVVAEMRAVLDRHSLECDVLVEHPRTAADVAACALAGADGVIVEPDVLRALLLHPLTDRGVDRRLAALSRHHLGRGA